MGITILIAAFVTALALFFDFTNGFHDSANQVATVITSRTLSPGITLILAALANFIGAYFLGTAVAETIGKSIVDPRILHTGTIGVIVIIAALTGAVLWNLITWYFGIPSSSSHALIGGLIGAFFFGWGPELINWYKVWQIILIMIVSPIIGLVITYIFTRFTLVFSQRSTPKINRIFKKLQIGSLITQSLAHGTNDAQKTMGVITFTLIILGLYNPQGGSVSVPKWVIISCASAMAVGTATGGWRIIRTLGSGLYKVRPIHSFTSQSASTIIIYITAVFGFPISTTQVISSSIMGAGAAFRPKMVRWQVAQDMAVAWLVTIPASGFIAGLTFFILEQIFK
ncbi:MAG: inorganic phosphate transporter [Elusimicrobia bacterium]|nr:inorganic phosphate transporter [Elusimicrobiota bacterium]